MHRRQTKLGLLVAAASIGPLDPMKLPNLLATRHGRLSAFFFLYVTEGLPLGFTATAVATQMRRQGLGPSEIGVFVGTLYLPWAWKWVAGPFVDLFYSAALGRRRGWIVAMQVLMSTTLLLCAPIDFTAEVRLFTLLIMAVNVFGATQDVAIDALACGVLREDERGLANGLMFAGAYMGQAAGGAGVLLLASLVGFSATFFAVAAAILTVTLCVALGMREPLTAPRSERQEVVGIWGELCGYGVTAIRAFVGTRAAMVATVIAMLPAGAYSLSLALQSNLAVELGLSDRKIALLALLSTVLSALGCVAGGYLSDRYGRKRMLAIYLVGTAIPVAFLGWVMARHGWIMPIDPRMPDRPLPPEVIITAFWAANIVYAIFQGLMYGTRAALFMDICTPAVAATQFTAYMALLNLVIWYSATWQGYCIEAWGYPATLGIDAAAGLVCLALLPLMARDRFE